MPRLSLVILEIHARPLWIASILLMPIAFASSAAQSPDRPRIGLVLGSSVGVIWHVSDRFALRPSVAASKWSSSTRSDGGSAHRSSSWSYTAALDNLIYVQRREPISTYISMGISYQTGRSRPNLNDQYVIGVPASFGAQFSPHRRLSVWGEAGLALTLTRRTIHPTLIEGQSIGSSGKASSNEVSTRSSVGMVFYF